MINVKENSTDGFRGKPGSYARCHKGLAAFWNCTITDISKLHLTATDKILLKKLDNWLSGSHCGLFIVSHDPRSCTLLLVRWILSLIERKVAMIQYLPISPSFGTAIEREALQVLFGLFPAGESTLGLIPRSPRELRYSINDVPFLIDLEPEHLCSLTILDGIDQAADWRPDKGIPFLQWIENASVNNLNGRSLPAIEDKESVPKLVVSVRTDNPKRAVEEWRDRLSWSNFDNVVIQVPPDLYGSFDRTNSRHNHFSDNEKISESNQKIIDALCVSLAPISSEDLRKVFGVQVDLHQYLDLKRHGVSELTESTSSRTLHFISDAVPFEWTRKIKPKKLEAIEKRVVDRGLKQLSLLESGEDTVAAEYFVLYIGAHMSRRSASRTDLMRLVSPVWLDCWMRMPNGNGLVGFLTDARRARAAAENDLFIANTTDERRIVLRDLLWCAVVEATLLEKEGSHHIDLGDTIYPPYRAPTVNIDLRAGVERERAELVLALNRILGPSGRSKVSRWVNYAMTEYRNLGGEDSDLTVRHVPGWQEGPHVMSDFMRLFPAIQRTGKFDSAEVEFILQTSPSSIVDKIGLNQLLDIAWNKSTSPVGALSEIVPYLPEEKRKGVVKEFMPEYWHSKEERMSPAILACAPWMDKTDAVKILCEELGNLNEFMGHFREFLIGWTGIVNLAPLLWRLGGPRAIIDAISIVVKASKWLP